MPGRAVILTWFILSIVTALVALPRIADLGLYYDEAFLAQQARDFVEPERAGVHPPSVTTTTLADRPFPVRNAAYLGSLKSQLLIPSLAAFGSSTFVLRATTLATGLLALLFCMLLTKKWFGDEVAIVVGLLIAADPSFFYFSQFEWGPFTTMLLCRSAGLYFLSIAIDPPSPGNRWGSLILGSVCLGLGVYSRVDFVVILAAIAVGTLLCRRDLVSGAWQMNRAAFMVGTGVFTLTLWPVFAVLTQILSASEGVADRGGFEYRLKVLMSVLDGSHFHRLMESAGLFEQLFETTAPATAFPIVLLAAVVVLALPNVSKSDSRFEATNFLLVTTALLGAAMLTLPGAVRAHHMLNLLPFPHMIVATAGVTLWKQDWKTPGTRSLTRGFVALAGVAILTSSATTIVATRSLIEETGGRGRFSRALQDFTAELDRPNEDGGRTTVMSLDWGFHEPVLFTSNHLIAKEPIWAMAQYLTRRGRFIANGDANTVYLYHEEPYDLFGYGKFFARALRQSDADRYEITEHRDRRGDVVFKSARFDAPHRLTFDGIFRIRFLEAASR